MNLIEEDLGAMISEINMIGGSKGWWVDTSASRPVYYDRSMFKSYTEAKHINVLLGDSHSTLVTSSGDVCHYLDCLTSGALVA